MTIGRFSRLTGLSVKALRHYDELGLLRPAAVDGQTGYRSYSSAQVGQAEAIRTLRRLELPLDDIATLLSTDDPATVRRVLVDHQRRTAWRSAQLNAILQGLQPLIDGKESVMGTHVGGARRGDRATARRRPLQQDVDVDGEDRPDAGGGRRDDPLRARVGVSLASGRARRRTARAANGSARACTRSSATSSRRCVTRERCLELVEANPTT